MKIRVKYYRPIDTRQVFYIPVSEWKRFSKEDQRFLRKNKTFMIRQLGYPIVCEKPGQCYYVEELA